MNGSSILLHDGDYILHKSIDIKNCKKGIIIKGKNPGKVQLRCDKPLKGKLRPSKDTQTKNRVHPNAQGIIMEIDLSEIGINVPFFPDLMKERKNFPQLIYNNELLPLFALPQQRLSIYEKGIGQFRNKRTRRYF